MQSPIETALVLQQDFGPVEVGDTSTLSVGGGRDEQQIRIEEQLLQKNKDLTKTLNRVIRLQHRQHTRMSEMKGQITDLRRRLDESDSKNREISAKIGQLIATNTLPDKKTPGNGKSSSSSGSSSCSDTLSHDSTNERFRNMKPRSATIILKRITEDNDLSSKCVVKRPKLE